MRKLKYIVYIFMTGILIACSNNPSSEIGHMETVEEEAPRGPNGGILLEQDDFALEVTIFESGASPKYRLYAYENGEALSASDVRASITLTRLDGEKNEFNFTAQGDFLTDDNIVNEPHSFDVDVRASYNGKSYNWNYPSYEGRVEISPVMANQAEIGTENIGPATIEITTKLLGDIEFAPNARAALKATYPGKILSVLKFEGEQVQKGELLARIENSASLQPYEVRSPLDGVVVASYANQGDVVNEEELFIIGDLSRLRIDFHVYAGDQNKIKPGQKTTVRSIMGNNSDEIILDHYLPEVDGATQTAIIHADLANPDLKWLPGMKVEGKVVTDLVDVPLAVRTRALQRFRDFTVVFAKIDDTYEVRMLELGRQTEEWTEVLGGIKPGQEYVTENSFIIKADIEKSGASHDH